MVIDPDALCEASTSLRYLYQVLLVRNVQLVGQREFRALWELQFVKLWLGMGNEAPRKFITALVKSSQPSKHSVFI